MARQGKARQQVEAVLSLDKADVKRRGMTAYDIARVTGFSPQHINRILAQMWHEGMLAFRPKDRKHQLMSPRLWSWAGIILSFDAKGWYVSEARLRQEELL